MSEIISWNDDDFITICDSDCSGCQCRNLDGNVPCAHCENDVFDPNHIKECVEAYKLDNDKIKSLETKLQIATEALEFYGDEKMWHGAKYKNHTATLEHGYTRAKEALEKIGGV